MANRSESLFLRLERSVLRHAFRPRVSPRCPRPRTVTTASRPARPPRPVRTLRAGVLGSAVAAAGLAAAAVAGPYGGASADGRDPGKPRFRLDEVKKHGAGSDRPWVVYKDGVYDITDWVGAHPGGDVILRAAGGSIDRYWDIFAIHKQPYVREILDQYLIGFVHADDLVDGQVQLADVDDPFKDEPARDARLRVLTRTPCNAETPPEELQSSITPNEVFYVRNHMWVPRVDDPRRHSLTVELTDGSTREYTLEQLRQRFAARTVKVTLQCSGNRRGEMTRDAGATNGIQWGGGAISTAEWEGVRLSDVLADAGLSADDARAKHVQFSGLEAYGASIPIAKAADPRGDVLLAWGMNGKPLPPDHGYPLRVVVPGNVAARSVKWVSKIVVSDEESPSQWQRRDYKCFGPNVRSPDWDSAPAIQEMPVTSVATKVAARRCSLSGLQKVCSGTVSGYAYSGGGRAVIRVDVSLDEGRTWRQARLLDDATPGEGNSWAWRRWELDADDLAFAGGADGWCGTVLVKATDEAYNTQPTDQKDIWNARGNLAVAWNRRSWCLCEGGDGTTTVKAVR